MTLTLGSILASEDIGSRPDDSLVIRHAYVLEHEDSGLRGIQAHSSDDEILEYTSVQGITFPKVPPQYWIVFIREGGQSARLWGVVENRGEVSNDGVLRKFDLVISDKLEGLRSRLVITWRAARSWRMTTTTASTLPVLEIADAEPVPFPGFDRIVLNRPELKAVMRDPIYHSWRVALASVVGVYLITDIRDGRQYVGKADGADRISQRWTTYAINGHGGNVELRNIDPDGFIYSLLRVFDPSMPTDEVNKAESHFKKALGTREHGLNRN